MQKIFLDNTSMCILTHMNLLPPIFLQTWTSRILFACVIDGFSLVPQPCLCMLVKVALNDTIFYM
jgi:hypothetical protein